MRGVLGPTFAPSCYSQQITGLLATDLDLITQGLCFLVLAQQFLAIPNPGMDWGINFVLGENQSNSFITFISVSSIVEN